MPVSQGAIAPTSRERRMYLIREFLAHLLYTILLFGILTGFVLLTVGLLNLIIPPSMSDAPKILNQLYPWIIGFVLIANGFLFLTSVLRLTLRFLSTLSEIRRTDPRH